MAQNDKAANELTKKIKKKTEDRMNGIKSSAFVKKVPHQIDILNEYRQKFNLKRNYATPAALRDGDHFFTEEFYNKARASEIIRSPNGVETVLSLEEKQESVL